MFKINRHFVASISLGKWRNLFFCLVLAVFCTRSEALHKENVISLDSLSKDWWETASFYQIYPRSFKDSDGDGIGDINGITEKLEYLKEIGITATWLSPIFKSPMADFGYDISDFYDIQPEYGTIADLDKLIERAQSLGIKIFLDFVPNHSSDENEWFRKSVNKEPGFEDYYIWNPGYVDKNNASNRLPPNNWISVFRKSAWEWNEQRREFYFHQFLVKQPDLNYRNPKLVDEMKKVIRFWLDRGVAGFRIDAVPQLFEVSANAEGQIPNEPLSGITNDPEDHEYLNHIYTLDQPETIDMVYQWRQVLDDYKKEHGGETRAMMTESYSPLSVVMQYYGNSTHNGSHMPFNFQMILRLKKNSNAHDYINCIDDWITNMPKGRTPNWVIGNHDNSRVGSRVGVERIDALNMINSMLSGASITYYGEEIGMTDQWISWEDTIDPPACKSNPKIYEYITRDPERTPFQWNDQRNAGFSTAKKTWLPVATTYKDVNVEKENAAKNSHLKVYKQLQKLRRERAVMYGNVQYGSLSNQVLAIIRQLDGEPAYITVANVGPLAEHVNLKTLLPNLPDQLVYQIVAINSLHTINEKVSSLKVILRPYESFVLRTMTTFRNTRASNLHHRHNLNAV